MKTLLATHIARFESSYSPQSNTRIMRYLRTRAKGFKVEFPTFSKSKGKGKVKWKSSPSSQVKRIYGGTQRSWSTSEQHIQVSTPCTNRHCIDMNTAHTHSIDACRNKFSRLGSPGKGKKARAKVRMAKAAARAPRACPKARDHAKVSKADLLHPLALRSCSYQHSLMGHPLPRPKAQLTSPVTSVNRRVTTSLNALNGWRFGHSQRISKHVSRFLD